MTSAHLESFIAFDNDESNVPAIKLIIPSNRLGKCHGHPRGHGPGTAITGHGGRARVQYGNRGLGLPATAQVTPNGVYKSLL